MKNFFLQMWTNIKVSIINAGNKLIWAIAFFIVALILIKLILNITRKLLNKKHKTKIFKSFIVNLVKYSLTTIMFLILAEILGVPNSTILAVASTATLAIGLTMQGILSNIANGMLLINGRIFNEGNFVQIENITGTVTNIGLINLQLTTPDNKIIYLPNSKVMTSVITNFDTQDIRRVDIEFMVGYGTDIDSAKGLINYIVSMHPLILQEKDKIIRLLRQNENSLTITCRVWCKRTDYFKVYFDLMESVYKTLNENKIIMQSTYEVKK